MAESQVSVILTPVSFTDEFDHRVINLDPTRTEARVGRCSKSSAKNLLPGKENGLFDSPVMSREHAKLYIIPPYSSAVFVKDSGSMHGTTVNGMPLGRHISFPLKNGDKLRFGSAVSRGNDTFHAREVQVKIEWAKWHPPTPEASSSSTGKASPVVFAVPDGSSDSEQEDIVPHPITRLHDKGIRVPDVTDSEHDSDVEVLKSEKVEIDLTISSPNKATLRSTSLGATHTRFESPEAIIENEVGKENIKSKKNELVTSPYRVTDDVIPETHSANTGKPAARAEHDMPVGDDMSSLRPSIEDAVAKNEFTKCGLRRPYGYGFNLSQPKWSPTIDNWDDLPLSSPDSPGSPGYSPEASPRPENRACPEEQNSRKGDSPMYYPESEPLHQADDVDYIEPASPGYSPPGSPGYSMLGAPGYSPCGSPGYSGGSPGYSPSGSPGYSPRGSPGYSPRESPGYSPQDSPGNAAPGPPAQKTPWSPLPSPKLKTPFSPIQSPELEMISPCSLSKNPAKEADEDVVAFAEFSGPIRSQPEVTGFDRNMTASRVTIDSLVHQQSLAQNKYGDDARMVDTQADNEVGSSSMMEVFLPQLSNAEDTTSAFVSRLSSIQKESEPENIWNKNGKRYATETNCRNSVYTDSNELHSPHRLEKNTPTRISINDIVNYPTSASPGKSKRKADQISDSGEDLSLLAHGALPTSSQDSFMQDAQPRDYPLHTPDIEIFIPLNKNNGSQTSDIANQGAQPTPGNASERVPKRRKTTHTWRRSFATHAATALTSAIIGGAGVFFGLLALPESRILGSQ